MFSDISISDESRIDSDYSEVESEIEDARNYAIKKKQKLEPSAQYRRGSNDILSIGNEEKQIFDTRYNTNREYGHNNMNEEDTTNQTYNPAKFRYHEKMKKRGLNKKNNIISFLCPLLIISSYVIFRIYNIHKYYLSEEYAEFNHIVRQVKRTIPHIRHGHITSDEK